jgi:hypothetical protein
VVRQDEILLQHVTTPGRLRPAAFLTHRRLPLLVPGSGRSCWLLDPTQQQG